jgi:hypothetical protein
MRVLLVIFVFGTACPGPQPGPFVSVGPATRAGSTADAALLTHGELASTSTPDAASTIDQPTSAHDVPRLLDAVDVQARLDVMSHELPTGAPSVVIHAPMGLALDRIALVVYLHGWEGCARVIAGSGPVSCRDGDPFQQGWGLAERHDDAATNSVFVVPQLAWNARSSVPGRFTEPGFADLWLAEVVDRVLGPRLGIEGPAALSEIAIVAHSGGYRTTLSLIENAKTWPVHSIALFDALYDGSATFAAWTLAVPTRRIVSLHTFQRDTASQSRLLARRVAEKLGLGVVSVDPPDLAKAIRGSRVVAAQSSFEHGSLPAGELTGVLRALEPGGHRDSSVPRRWDTRLP